MNYVVGETKFQHKRYGCGVLAAIEAGYLMIMFEQGETKKFESDAVKKGFLKVVDKKTVMPAPEKGTDFEDHIQFDTSSTIIGDMNVAEAIRTDKDLIFNESYTVIGKQLATPSLYAHYDLTIIGDLNAEQIVVNGNLRVMGNIKAKRLECLKGIICDGDIDVGFIIGTDIVANNIRCMTLNCSGNVFTKMTIDIKESLDVENSVVTGEGVVGRGVFRSANAVAVEYFEFDGQVEGEVIELDTMSRNTSNEPDCSSYEIEGIYDVIKEKMSSDLNELSEVNEQQLLDYMRRISVLNAVSMSNWHRLTQHALDILHTDQIKNLKDYLFLIMAKMSLPKEVLECQMLNHVFSTLLPNAEKNLYLLPFQVTTMDELIFCLRIVELYPDELGESKEELFEKIFQCIGIKYKTAKHYLDII